MTKQEKSFLYEKKQSANFSELKLIFFHNQNKRFA